MALNHTSIRTALWDRLQDALGNDIKTWYRRDPGGDAIAAAAKPAVVLRVEAAPADSDERAQPPIWHPKFVVEIYTDQPRLVDDPDAELERLVASVEAALEKRPGERGSSWWTTLGGACVSAAISGVVDYGDDQRGYGFVLVPVETLMPTTKVGRPSSS